MELEDRGAQIVDGGVDVVDGSADPLLGLRPDHPVHALQLQSGGEQPLDHQVVQVPGDPVAVLQYGDHRPVALRLGAFEGERGLVGEHPDQIGPTVTETGSRPGSAATIRSPPVPRCRAAAAR